MFEKGITCISLKSLRVPTSRLRIMRNRLNLNAIIRAKGNSLDTSSLCLIRRSNQKIV